MIKEAKKNYYGKWAFLAGHLEENKKLYELDIIQNLEDL